MASIVEQYQQDNPSVNPPNPQSNIAQQYQQDNPATVKSDQGTYINALIKGAARNFSAIPLTGFEPPKQMEAVSEANQEYRNLSPEEKENLLNKDLPSPNNFSGRALERVGEALPFAAPLGASAALGAGIGAITEEGLKERYPNNPLYVHDWGPLVAAVGITPLADSLINFAGKTIRSAPETFGYFQSSGNKLWSDLGMANNRIAGASTDMRWPMQIQNSLRESLGGSGTITGRENQIFEGIEKYATEKANQLGPNLTQEELGNLAVGAVKPRIDQMAKERDGMHNALAYFIPRNNDIDPVNFTNALADIKNKYSGAPELGKFFQQSGIDKMSIAANKDLWNSPNGTIPYGVLQNMRTDIGEMVQKGMFNADINTREYRYLYKALSDDMRSAYPAWGQSAFDAVNRYDARSFDTVERVLQPLIQQGITPETVAQRIMSQINKGSTRFEEVTEQLSRVDPTIRDTFLSYTLRQLGENPQGEFSPIRFYNTWNKLSPEIQDMFPTAQRQGIEMLADASGMTKNMFIGANTSHTSGNLNIMNMVNQFSNGLSLIAGGTAGAASGIAGLGHEAEVGLATAGTTQILRPFIETAANNMLAKMWTSKWFPTWLSTQGPGKTLNSSLAGIGAMVEQSPDLLGVAQGLVNSATLQTGERGRGFMGGGYSGWPEQSPTGYSNGGSIRSGGGSGAQWIKMSEGGEVKDEDYIEPPPKKKKPESDDTGFALGGLTHTPSHQAKRGHPNKFKGQRLEGYAQGGPIGFLGGGSVWQGNNANIMGYAEGGTVSYLDRFLDSLPGGDNIPADAAFYGRQRKEQQGDKVVNPPRLPPVAMPKIEDTPDPDSKDVILGHPRQMAQGGVSHNTNDPRPFYNPQLPGVSNQFAEGGITEANENELPHGGNIIDMFMNQGKIPIGGGHGGGIKARSQIPGNISYGDSVNAFGPTEGGELKEGEMVGDLIKNGEPYLTWSKTPDVDLPPTINSNDNIPNRATGGYIEASAMGYADGGDVDDITNRIIGNESGGNANAKNPLSSASGKGQFINSTWINMMHKYHPEITNPLAYKNDPGLGTEMTKRYAQENGNYLQQKGLPVNGSTLYLSHFLGPAGAEKVLTSDPSTSVAALFGPAVLRANPFLRNMTASQLISMIDKKMGGQGEVQMASSKMPNQESQEEEGQGQPSIIDQFVQEQQEEPQEGDNLEHVKEAIQSAPWIQPLTKVASDNIFARKS